MSSNPISETDQVEVHPVTGKIGAEVSGIRLSGRLESATLRALRQALLQYRVLFLRGQDHLDEAAHEEFGRLFGDLAPHPTVPVVPGTESVLEINSERGAGAIFWHSDVTFVDAYPQASILRALVVPSHGGDTVWANTAAGYQSLPGKLRDLADHLWALHSNAYDYARARSVQ
jgi:alpha-ketoglutarate-dependent taurine dioxygenase